MRKLVYLVAVTADGFIADAHGGTDFFGTDPETLDAIFAEYPETCPAHLRQLLGVDGEPRHFDAVVMGYRTPRPWQLVSPAPTRTWPSSCSRTAPICPPIRQ